MTFHFGGGRCAQNLEDFLLILPGLPEDEYRAYVQRDDFARWIDDALGMKELAARISGIESRQTVLEHVRRAIESSRLSQEPIVSREAVQHGVVPEEPSPHRAIQPRSVAEPLLPREAIQQGLQQETRRVPSEAIGHHPSMKNFIAGVLVGMIVGLVIGVLLVWS